jgi:hypothetical protein
MSDGTAVAATAPITTAPTQQTMQHASPEERERMRAFGLGTAGMDGEISAARTGGDWTAVHLLSADEVKSLFWSIFFIHLCFTAGLNLCGFMYSIVNYYCVWISNLGTCF